MQSPIILINSVKNLKQSMRKEKRRFMFFMVIMIKKWWKQL